MHRHREDQAQRLMEVQELADPPVVQDLRGPGQVPRTGQHAGVFGQQVPGVGEDLGVVVDVDDPGVRGNGLGGLVGVRRGRQPAADIEELADPLLRGIGDGAGLELAGLDHQLRRLRVDLQNVPRLLAVGLEVVLAAEQEIVDPGDRGHRGVDLYFGDPQFARSRSTVCAWANTGRTCGSAASAT